MFDESRSRVAEFDLAAFNTRSQRNRLAALPLERAHRHVRADSGR